MIEELNGDFLQWLRGFYHVARTGSVRKAATLMNRNPSTISYQLRCLEEELNVVLFDRFKRSMRITPEGRRLLGWTISTFETLKSLRSSVSNADGRLKGSIRMAGTLPIISLAVPAITRFIRNFPLVKLAVEREISMTVRRMVEDSEVDFGLLPVIRALDDLEVLFKARPLLVFAARNSWRIPPVPSLDDLKRLPYIAFMAPNMLDDLGYFAENSGLGDFITRNAIISVNNNHIMLRFILNGLGVGIMDELCFEVSQFGACWSELRVLPLDHLLPNRLYGILTRKGRRISPQSFELIKILRAYFMGLPQLDLHASCAPIQQPGWTNAPSEDGGAYGNGNGSGHKPGYDNDQWGAFPDCHGI